MSADLVEFIDFSIHAVQPLLQLVAGLGLLHDLLSTLHKLLSLLVMAVCLETFSFVDQFPYLRAHTFGR